MIQGCQQKCRRSGFFNKLGAQQCSSLSDSNGADSDIKVCLPLTCDFSARVGGRINEHNAFFTTSRNHWYYERSTTFFFLSAAAALLSCLWFFCDSVTSVKSYFWIICQLQNDDVNPFSVVESVLWFFLGFFFQSFASRCFINTSARQHYLRRNLRRQETLFQEQSLSAKMNCERLKIEALF